MESALDHPVFGIGELLTLLVVGAGPRAALAMRRTCCFARDVVDRAINDLLADPVDGISLPSLLTLRVADPLELLCIAVRMEHITNVCLAVNTTFMARSLVLGYGPIYLGPSCALPVLRALLSDNDLTGRMREMIESHAIRLDDLALFRFVNRFAEDIADEYPWSADVLDTLKPMLKAGAMRIAEYWLRVNFARKGHFTPLRRGTEVITLAVHLLPKNDYASWARLVTLVSTLSGINFAAELRAPVDVDADDDINVALDTMTTRIGLPMMGAMLSIESALYTRRLVEPNFGHPPVEEEEGEEEKGEEAKEPATKRLRID